MAMQWLATLALAAQAASGIGPVSSGDAGASVAEQPTVIEPAIARRQHVTLSTSSGDIVIALEVERAPRSSEQFLRYVDSGRMQRMTFYRALDLGRGYGLLQGGTRGLPSVTLPPIPHEPTSATGLSHSDGAISWARLAPGTAAGDFFIIVGGLTALDAQPAGSGGDPDGFAVFGHVVAGMDVVRAILSMPTDPEAGEGVMRGQMLVAPYAILSARRSEAPVEPEAVSSAPGGTGEGDARP